MQWERETNTQLLFWTGSQLPVRVHVHCSMLVVSVHFHIRLYIVSPGARLLHLELEQEARAAGVTIPFMMTLDAQWAVEDSLSGGAL